MFQVVPNTPQCSANLGSVERVMVLKALVSNDDGVSAVGIAALTKGLKDCGNYDVRVVAPESERSGCSHSVTLYEPVRARYSATGPPQGLPVDVPTWSVSGTPVDAVSLALSGDLFSATAKESGGNASASGWGTWRPDVVVSGINRGPNFAMLTYYSGTFSAAREAAFQGVKGLSVSMNCTRRATHGDFEQAASIVVPIVNWLAQEDQWPLDVVLNVNIPWTRGWNQNQGQPGVSGCIPKNKLIITPMGSTRLKPKYSVLGKANGGVGNDCIGSHEVLDLGFKISGSMQFDPEGSIESDDAIAVSEGLVTLTPVAPCYCFEDLKHAFSILSSWRKSKKHPILGWSEISNSIDNGQEA